MSVHYERPDILLSLQIIGLLARQQTPRDNYGQSLGYGHFDHSVRACTTPNMNVSGVVNPELGTADDGGVFVCWEKWVYVKYEGGKERARS